MKNTLFFLSLFLAFNCFAQEQEQHKGLRPLDPKFRQKSTYAVTLDSSKINKAPKKQYVVTKNYVMPKSDSYYDIVEYAVKKQFQDKPIYSWALTVIFGIWILRTIKGLF